MDVLFETFPQETDIDLRLVQLDPAKWKIALRGEIGPGDDAILKVWSAYPPTPTSPPTVTLLATVKPHFAVFVPV